MVFSFVRLAVEFGFVWEVLLSTALCRLCLEFLHHFFAQCLFNTT